MENEENVVRLAKPQKKGILRIVFSRFLLIFLLLAIEVGIVVTAFLYLDENFSFVIYILRAFSVVMIVYLFNNSMDYTAKLTWMFLMAILPIPGAAMLLFTQSNIGYRMLKKHEAQLIEETSDAIPQPKGVLEKLRQDSSGVDDLHTYLNRSGCFPVFDDTEAVYYPSGEEMFAAVLEELKKAERYVFLEFFILQEGYMWGEILRILTEKARAGVDVRVMYDGMCEISHLPSDYWRLLEREGIRARAFSPIRPVVSSHYNYRDHRKILVIDGKTAFNGGVNLADEYINRTERFGHWKDTAVMIRGSAAVSFTLMFLQMWCIGEEKPEIMQYLETDGNCAGNASGFVMPYADTPLDQDKVGETVYMDILHRARRYVHIMTPYLILDGELETAIKYAAQRGVDVRIILPGIPDKKIAWSLAKTHYGALSEAGVRLYEYTPGFVHAKVFVSDDIRAVAGSINLDYRSLYHHFECATYLYRTECIPLIEQDFRHTLAKCTEVTQETIRNEKLVYKIMGSLARLFAPLM